ncbi:MAG: rod shape determining protein RodA [Anaerolineaceae bacterium]|nr:MAG: rod shape determining protein RodA [Anaerolineaceae bacterium]
MFQSERWRHFDFWLLGAVFLALVFGVAMIRSAIGCNLSLAALVQRQMIFAGLGFLVIMLVALIDYRFWGGAIVPMYAVIVGFLLILYLTAGQRFGAARWIETGLVSIQPTELAKIVVILSLAYFFGKNMNAPRTWGWLVKSLLIAGAIAFLIFIQPNLSNVIVILVIWAVMAWVSGLPLKQLAIIAVVGLALAVIAFFFFMQEYQQDRVLTFLFPDPEARHGATYNVDQALIAIGSGGLSGKGYGLGTQTQLCFMKVRHTDFIFSVIGEEFGFIGAVLNILLLGFIIYRCLRAARLARDSFGSMIAFGVAILIFFQGAVNIAVNMRLMPVTGLPLPFISYGGSGLLSMMLGVGLVESVILRHKPLDF